LLYLEAAYIKPIVHACRSHVIDRKKNLICVLL